MIFNTVTCAQIYANQNTRLVKVQWFGRYSRTRDRKTFSNNTLLDSGDISSKISQQFAVREIILAL